MPNDGSPLAGISRRRLLTQGAGLGVAGMAAGAAGLPAAARAAGATSVFDDHLPYAIPWLDQNLHHNQVPTPGGPPTELSHLFHFQGTVGRALFSGEGTTRDGRTLYIGKGTDYGFSSGHHLAANGEIYRGSYAHI